MQNSAVESDKCHGIRSDLLRVTHRPNEIRGESLAAMHRNPQQNIILVEQATELVDKHVLSSCVVCPGGVQRCIVGETTNIEWSVTVSYTHLTLPTSDLV